MSCNYGVAVCVDCYFAIFDAHIPIFPSSDNGAVFVRNFLPAPADNILDLQTQISSDTFHT